jgi:hypothetical protein
MKGRKHREAGGENEAAEDLKSKPERYNESRVEGESEERKSGGRTKARRKRKHGGEAEGDKAMHHAGRKARKSGGSCDSSPFSSARSGTFPKGRKMDGDVE